MKMLRAMAEVEIEIIGFQLEIDKLHKKLSLMLFVGYFGSKIFLPMLWKFSKAS